MSTDLIAARAMVVLAGVVVLASASPRWIASGTGSSFGGLELADNLRNGGVAPSWGTWAAAVVYSLVATGGALIALSAAGHPAALAARLAVAGIPLALLIYTAVRGGFPFSRWGPGMFMQLGGHTVAVVATVYEIVMRRTAGRSSPSTAVPSPW